MIVKHLTVGPLAANCFIIGDDKSGESVVIDPGGDAPQILSVIEKEAIIVKYIVNTHGHFDHVGANAEVKEATGAKLLIHKTEDPGNAKADGYLAEGDFVEFGPYKLKVLDTPGHSIGGISLYMEEAEVVFVGDSLFAGSIGRTDFPGASFDVLAESIRTKIYTLPDQTMVMPGHGLVTSVGQEKRSNPFVNGTD